MSVQETALKIIIVLVVTAFGAFASGLIYDALWSVGNAIHDTTDCSTLPDGWIALCEDEKAKYESGKMLIQSTVVIGLLVLVSLFIIKQ